MWVGSTKRQSVFYPFAAVLTVIYTYRLPYYS
jgi:hypothetical protein